MFKGRIEKFIITGILFIILMFPVSCEAGEKSDKDKILEKADTEISIADIITDPKTYVEKIVTLTGEYKGWESGYGTAPVTRSDWVLKDTTGGIFITGKIPSGLDPVGDRGTEVSVYGKVKFKDNQVYIEAIEIK
jgi:hypothetical protein